jgi:drug/metabolite transporter (DMT)-like permease
MDIAIVFAVFSGVSWGTNMVIVRWSLDKTRASSDVGALVSIGSAAVVALALALLTGADASGLTFGTIARFSLVGAIAPGAAQVLFMAAIRTIGPARGGVLIGTAPMFAVVLAIIFLDEDWRVGIIVGTLATVAGGVLLSWDNSATTLSTSIRRIGVLLALTTAVAFGVRDVVARHFASGTSLNVTWAAVVVLTSGTLALGLITLFRTRHLVTEIRSTLPSMMWSGLVVGIALPALLESLSRGEVGVVAPINNGAQVVTVVILSSIFFGKRERSWRVFVALALVVAGGTLIGVSQ